MASCAVLIPPRRKRFRQPSLSRLPPSSLPSRPASAVCPPSGRMRWSGAAFSWHRPYYSGFWSCARPAMPSCWDSRLASDTSRRSSSCRSRSSSLPAPCFRIDAVSPGAPPSRRPGLCLRSCCLTLLPSPGRWVVRPSANRALSTTPGRSTTCRIGWVGRAARLGWATRSIPSIFCANTPLSSPFRSPFTPPIHRNSTSNTGTTAIATSFRRPTRCTPS